MSQPRIINLTSELMRRTIGTKRQFCRKCKIEFSPANEKQVVTKGNGKNSGWYHVDCAKLVNLI